MGIAEQGDRAHVTTYEQSEFGWVAMCRCGWTSRMARLKREAVNYGLFHRMAQATP